MSERDLVAAVADQLNLPFWDPTTTPVSPLVDGAIPADIARKHMVVGVDIGGRLPLGRHRQPARRGGSDDGQPGNWLEGQALLGDPLRHQRGALGYVRPNPATSAASFGGGQDEPSQLHVNQMLVRLVELKGSDLHLTSGLPPMVRVDGSLRPLEGFDVLIPSKVRDLVYGILSQKIRTRFEDELEMDTSHVVPGVGRFRVNVFQQRDSVGAVFRAIPFEIMSLEDLGLPSAIRQFTDLPRGLVLVTGPNWIGQVHDAGRTNRHHQRHQTLHIISVEDPIEYLHTHKRAVVNQREVGEDTKGFAEALKHVLRQDPDVILVGEMRDLETVSTALTAAETGHLVFATLHTQDAPQSIDRMIDVFPAHQQQQIRTQLAVTIQGIVTQQLLPKASGSRGGLWPAKYS